MSDRKPGHGMSTRRVGLIMLALCALLGVLLGVLAPMASAATVKTQTPAVALAAVPASIQAAVPMQAPPLISEGTTGSSGSACSTSQQTLLLPVHRWSGAMNDFHTRLHGGLNLGDEAKGMQRQVIDGMLFSIGNVMWDVTSSLTEMAMNFCVLDKLGAQVDRISGNIAHAIADSGILAVLVGFSLIFYLWRIGRGQGGTANWSALLQKGLILGFFVVLMVGASASTTVNGHYEPGTGSPGWWTRTIDRVVSNSATALTASLQKVATPGTSDSVYSANDNSTATSVKGYHGLGCGSYVQAMHNAYQKTYGASLLTNASASVPLTLSVMWENSTIPMYENAQFGTQDVVTQDGENTTYADLVYCRLLDMNANVPTAPSSKAGNHNIPDAGTVTALLAAAGAETAYSGGSGSPCAKYGLDTGQVTGDPGQDCHLHSMLPFNFGTDGKKQDRVLVGWAACATGPSADGRALIHQSGGSQASAQTLAQNCNSLFTDKSFDGNGSSGIVADVTGSSGTGSFDWDESTDDISDASTPQVSDFISILHGSHMTGFTTGIVFVISSLIIALVFGAFACAILVAKVAVLIMMIGLVMALVMALSPNQGLGAVVNYAKQYFGLSLFVWGAQFIMALIALIASLLISAGNGVLPGGQGGILAVLWTGLSPVFSFFCLHMLFKKLRIPSPLKLSGGMAWGQMAAAGAVGAGAGFGLGALADHGLGMMRRGGARMGRKASGAVIGKGRGRSNTMQPGRNGQADPSAAGAAAGLGKPGSQEEWFQGRVDKSKAKAERSQAKAWADANPDDAKLYVSRGTDSVRARRGERSYGQDRTDVKGHLRTAARFSATHAQQRFAEIGQQFKDKPFRTTLKTAAGIGLGAAAVTTAPMTIPLVGTAVAAKVVGRSGVRKASRYMSGTQYNADVVEAYRRWKVKESQQGGGHGAHGGHNGNGGATSGGQHPSAQDNGHSATPQATSTLG